ncbi:MAG: hypothetical protein KKA90_04445 [Nanoarchaeota archaeon]|nr:hypothetical protein [Nanoarchaeota archaeon]
MRGVTQTLWIIVAAIVIMVTALVVLTIFGTSIVDFTSLGEASAFCQTQAASTCEAAKALPPTWHADTVSVNGEPTSCFATTNIAECSQVP